MKDMIRGRDAKRKTAAHAGRPFYFTAPAGASSSRCAGQRHAVRGA